MVRPQRILVVDDNADIRDFARDLLAAEFPGSTVVVAPNAEQALERALASGGADVPFDLIVTDHQMGRTTGLDLLRGLHREARAFRTVLMSSSIEAELASREDVAVDVFLRKPFDVDELLDAARIHLRAKLR